MQIIADRHWSLVDRQRSLPEITGGTVHAKNISPTSPLENTSRGQLLFYIIICYRCLLPLECNRQTVKFADCGTPIFPSFSASSLSFSTIFLRLFFFLRFDSATSGSRSIVLVYCRWQFGVHIIEESRYIGVQNAAFKDFTLQFRDCDRPFVLSYIFQKCYISRKITEM